MRGKAGYQLAACLKAPRRAKRPQSRDVGICLAGELRDPNHVGALGEQPDVEVHERPKLRARLTGVFGERRKQTRLIRHDLYAVQELQQNGALAAEGGVDRRHSDCRVLCDRLDRRLPITLGAEQLPRAGEDLFPRSLSKVPPMVRDVRPLDFRHLIVYRDI